MSRKSIIANITCFDKRDRVTHDIVVEAFTKQALVDAVLCQKNNPRTVSVIVEILPCKIGKVWTQTSIKFSQPKAKHRPAPGFHENHHVVNSY